MLNNRPITSLSDDPRDGFPLTLNMLLKGVVDFGQPQGTFIKADRYRKSWKLVQYLTDPF